MGLSKDYNRGFDDAVAGKPPPYTGNFAEWQGHQAGQQQREAQARPVVYSRISLPPWLERALGVLSVVLAWIGFAAAGWVAYRIARELGATVFASLAWGLLGGLGGAGAGAMLPRLVVGAALIVWALAVFAVLVAVVLVSMRFGAGLLR